MKIKSYRILFNILSYLSDKTNGASIFVKYKLMLGTLLIGLTAVSCKKPKPQVTCYDMSAPTIDTISEEQQEVDSVVTMCYFVPPKIAIDPKPEPPTIIDEPEPMITCYDMTFIEDTIPQVMPYETIDTPPIPPQGDLNKFAEWVLNKLVYPQPMMDNGIQGRTIAKIIIDTNGEISGIEIIRSIDPEADAEVRRILSLAESWIPGSHQGEPVNTSVIIPVTFRLIKEE